LQLTDSSPVRQRQTFFKSSPFWLTVIVVLCLTELSSAKSAIISLAFPVGARQLGMGETGVALTEDANSLYYNPAGMAFGPLADEWELSLPSKKIADTVHFSALAGRQSSGFLAKPELWGGGNSGMYHFDGKEWKEFHNVILEEKTTIRSIMERFMGRTDNLDSVIALVKEYNGIKTKADEEFLVELRIPWSLMIQSPVTVMFYEPITDKLWVGTETGLYRFDGKGWKDFGIELGKRHITSIEAQGATLWVGSKNGLFAYEKGKFVQKGNVLPGQEIQGLAWSALRKELYAGLPGHGIARLTPGSRGQNDKWSIYKAQDGLLDLYPRDIVVDSAGHIWVAHKGGISHFTLRKWEQIQFDKNEVYALQVAPEGEIWIGTQKGVWKHIPDYSTAKGRKVEAERKGESDAAQTQGKWVHYHTGNGLKSNHVKTIATLGEDMWFTTGAGIERFNIAERQVSLFYEKLLPVLNIPDLYHLYSGLTFPIAEWGTVGGFVNFISFGQTTVNNEASSEDLGSYNSSEIVASLSYGTRLSADWGLGLNFKWFFSDLSGGASENADEEQTASYAVDIGVLKRDLFIDGLNLGIALANIGPNVYYVDKSQEDPIPLTWRVGLAWKALQLTDHRIILAADLNRETIAYDERGKAEPFYVSVWKGWLEPEGKTPDMSSSEVAKQSIEEIVYNTGVEYTYANTISVRAGYLYDVQGKRTELDLGLGILISDILQLDIATIKEVGSNTDGVRDGQQRYSLLLRF